MKRSEEGVLVFRPDYEPEEIIEIPDLSPRRYRILYRGETDAPIRQWQGTAISGSRIYLRIGTIMLPLLSDGEDPSSGALRYIYRMKPDGSMEYWLRQQ